MRSNLADGLHHRMPYYHPPYRRGHHFDRDDFFFGGVVWPGLIGTYGYLGYPNFYQYPPWWDYNDSYDAQAPAMPQNYGSQPQEEYPEPPAWPSMNPPQTAPPASAPQPPAPAPQPSDAVTIVFNNSRPPEQIHNYLLTSATLFVYDDHHREIPVNEINLAATAKVNREAGVAFSLPAPAQ